MGSNSEKKILEVCWQKKEPSLHTKKTVSSDVGGMNRYALVEPEQANPKKDSKNSTRKKKLLACLGAATAPAFLFIVHAFYVQHGTFRLLERIGAQPVEVYIAPKQYAVVSIFIANGFDTSLYLQSLCKLNVAINRFASIDKVLMILGKYNGSDTCGWIPYAVKAIDGPKDKDPHANRYLTTKIYTKLRIWELIQYDAVVYIDLDTLVIGPFSQLFEIHLPLMRKSGLALGMGHNTFPRGSDFNSGVILLTPNLTLFHSLRRGINTIPHEIGFGDQNYLNAYFQRNIYPLPFQYNSMVSVKTSHPAFWVASQHSILHYTCKPWNKYNCWRDGIEDLCLLWDLYP
jgi:hypothetical protein